MARDSVSAIPRKVAFNLCAEIREQYRGKWYTLAGLQCWGCTLASLSNPAKRCINNRAGHRGCNLVNSRYDRRVARVSQS
jgi:hypothetical protein